jgi:transposase
MCQLLVGLGDVTVLGVQERWLNLPLEVHIECKTDGPPRCPDCGQDGVLVDQRPVKHVDLPCFGRRTKLLWHKRRWRCPAGCGTWTEQDDRIAPPRHVLADRAGRWATLQVGMNGRTVSEVAAELSCTWHTVNTAVIAFGTPLVDHPDRIGQVTALGLDEVGFARVGRIRLWSTSIVDVQAGRVLDVVPGRDALPAIRWLAGRDPGWLAAIRWATLDLARTCRKVFFRDAARRRPGG